MKKTIFLSHPFSDDPKKNSELVKVIEKRIVDAGYIPLSPLALFRMYDKDGDIREVIMQKCKELIDVSDAVWFYTYNHAEFSEGQLEEKEYASMIGKDMCHINC